MLTSSMGHMGGMGMDPATIAMAVKLGTDLVGSIFGGGGPSAAQIAAYNAEVTARREAAERQTWLVGGGLALVGIVAVMLISRRAS